MFYHFCQIEDSSCLNELWPMIAAFLDHVHIWLLHCVAITFNLHLQMWWWTLFTDSVFCKCSWAHAVTPLHGLRTPHNRIRPKDHGHPVLSVCLVPWTQTSPNSKNLLIILPYTENLLNFTVRNFFWNFITIEGVVFCRWVKLCPSTLLRNSSKL